MQLVANGFLPFFFVKDQGSLQPPNPFLIEGNCIESRDTPQKFNTSPLKKGWLEDEFPFGKATFQGLC